MNERFVCVKVDREERPDVDAMCMEAVQAMTGRGGWPLNAFLTPELIPFYAGTYFPPESRHGMPAWRMVLDAVAETWENRHDEIRRQGDAILGSLAASDRLEPSAEPIRQRAARRRHERAADRCSTRPTAASAGLRSSRSPSLIELLLVRGEQELALTTLRAMANGGIYDQIGGGFARYAVDATWTVPHFEKMLYDNALLARAYLHGWQVSREDRLLEVCTETLDWALREMRGPEGGFCSALDADSDGEEGKFYVWTLDELREALGPELAGEASAYFGATERGNFEHGTNVLEARGPRPQRLAEIRLQAVRGALGAGAPGTRRQAPDRLERDDGLGARGGGCRARARRSYLEAAAACASFLLGEMRDAEGRLLRTWKDGKASIDAYLEDYAFLLEALITLYESTFEERWYREAVALADTLIAQFEDREKGGFFTTARDRTELPVRRKDLEDSPVPSGNSAAAFALLRLALLSGEGKYERHALGVLRLLIPLASRHPIAFGHLLQAADFYCAPVREVAIVGPEPGAHALVRAVRDQFRPHIVLAGGDADGVPLLEGRAPVDGTAAAYVCEHFVCEAPVTGADELAAALS